MLNTKYLFRPFGLLIFAAALHAQTFHFAPRPGPYTVGLKVVQQYDHSRVYRSSIDALGRPYISERSRPLQTLIWYPAEAVSENPMTVKDYVDLLPNETEFDHPHIWSAWQEFANDLKPTYALSMIAVRDAKASVGHFPVVIYSPSINSMSWENADLCEYLASHGYVVLATPDLGDKTRGVDTDNRVVGAEANANDIEFLIGYAQTLPNTDMSQIAVAAFSWGGMANLFAASKDSRIRAMVELDTSFRYYPGFVKDAGFVHPDQMTIPLLYFSHGEASMEQTQAIFQNLQGATGPSVLNAWTHGDMIYVNMRGFVHGEFSSMYQRSEGFWKYYPGNQIADYSREDGITGYALVARYVLAFLDSYIKGDPAGTSFLKNTPVENGAPAHFVSINIRKAKGLAPTLDSLKIEVGKQGFDHLNAIYTVMKKDTPDFKPDQTEMSSWSNELIATGHLSEAIAVLKLNVEVYPDTRGGYTALGDAYAQTGQKNLAIESYKNQLEKTPGNPVVADKLKAMTER